MATRSKVLATGVTAGVAPVSIYTCPANVTAIAKYIGAGYNAGTPYANGTVFIFYKPAGGSVIPIAGAYLIGSAGGNWANVQSPGGFIWQVLEPQDELLIADDGTITVSVAISGAELTGVAP